MTASSVNGSDTDHAKLDVYAMIYRHFVKMCI